MTFTEQVNELWHHYLWIMFGLTIVTALVGSLLAHGIVEWSKSSSRKATREYQLRQLGLMEVWRCQDCSIDVPSVVHAAIHERSSHHCMIGSIQWADTVTTRT